MSSQFNLALIPDRAKEHFEANPNVLVIEDDKIMGQMVADILTDVGFKVTNAANGMIAFEKLKQHRIDFIVLDILLPELDGFEVYTRLQANLETRNIPVMIISAWADERNIGKASELGIKHFLPKPFTEDELMYTILTLLIDSSRNSG
jgi:DNA-binding response OmpR family regulator